MNFKPILFSTPMVQAILGGQKTQTRRTIKPQPDSRGLRTTNVEFEDWHGREIKPKAQIGDIFWVRETFQVTDWEHPTNDNYGYIYKASENGKDWEDNNQGWKWKPSIFMPKEACRLFLEVTDVRVERLQDISEADMIAEGIRVSVSPKGGALLRMTGKNPPFSFLPDGCLQDSYDGKLTQYDFLKTEWAALWSDINGRDSWDANPWVWVYEFKQINKPQNFI